MSIWFNGIQPQLRTVDGLSIRFAESEDRDDHALLLSPWPESLVALSRPGRGSLSRHIWWRSTYPGLGHSQRRDALLSPKAVGEFVIRLADALGA